MLKLPPTPQPVRSTSTSPLRATSVGFDFSNHRSIETMMTPKRATSVGINTSDDNQLEEKCRVLEANYEQVVSRCHEQELIQHEQKLQEDLLVQDNHKLSQQNEELREEVAKLQAQMHEHELDLSQERIRGDLLTQQIESVPGRCRY
jgi:hypothetical protein